MEKDKKQVIRGAQMMGNGIVKRIESQRDVIDDCSTYLNSLQLPAQEEHFLVVEKQYPPDSAIISKFAEEQKLSSIIPLQITRSVTDDSQTDTGLESDSVTTTTTFRNSWTTQHAVLRHVSAEVKKNSVTGANQLVRIYPLENKTVLEQGVVDADRERGMKRLVAKDFDFVRVLYVVPLTNKMVITDKRLWDIISRVTHVTVYQQHLYQLAKRVITSPDQRTGTTQLTSVSNKVIQLNKNTYNHIFPPIGWFVTPKLDGQHGVLMNLQMEGGIRTVLLGGEMVLFSQASQQRKQFAIEVEIIENELWVIDVMVPWDYDNQSRAHIAERVSSFPQYVSLAQALVGSKYKVFAKPYWEIERVVSGGSKKGKRPKRLGGILKALEKQLGDMVDYARERKTPVVSILERDDENARRVFRDVRKFVSDRVANASSEKTELISEAKNYAEQIAGSVTRETDTPAQRQLIEEAVTAAANFAQRGTDGVIFVSGDTDYRRNVVYKWKPSENLTIDFVAVRNEQSSDKYEYVLLSGIDPQQALRLGFRTLPSYAKAREEMFGRNARLVPIHFQPFIKRTGEEHRFNTKDIPEVAGSDLNGSCVELSWTAGKWKLHRVREDKRELIRKGINYGNNHFVAEKIWNQTLDPLTLEDLYAYKVAGYFGTGKDPAYYAITRYHSLVKQKLFSDFCRKPVWALDIASGKGQDMLRYLNCQPENVIFTDVDLLALDELVERRYKAFLSDGDERYMNTHVIHGDAVSGDTHAQINKTLNGGKLDLVVCSFAIHYMMAKVEELARFINQHSRDGCRVIFLFMDGPAIHDLFVTNEVKQGESFTFADSFGKPKYILRRQYESQALAPFGQSIDVKLPFKEELTREMLVNNAYLREVMRANGFSLEEQGGFAEAVPEEFEKLNEVDQTYSSLNMFQVFTKRAN